MSHSVRCLTPYASTNNLKCFECGNIGHKKWHKMQAESNANKANKLELEDSGEVADKSKDQATVNETEKDE